MHCIQVGMPPRAVLAASFAISTLSALAAPPPPPKCPPPVAGIHIANGSYSSQPDVTFQLHDFVGQLIPRGQKSPYCYLKYTQLERGEIFVTGQSLSNIFSSKLEDANSPLSAVKIETGDGVAKISGKVKKGVSIDFQIEGPVTTDGEGITIEAKKIKADGIPVKSLLAMVGKHLNSLMGGENVEGVSVKENMLTFQPAHLAQLRGHIASAVATPEGLTIRYLPANHARASGKSAPGATTKVSQPVHAATP